jgi:hypothetical protein
MISVANLTKRKSEQTTKTYSDKEIEDNSLGFKKINKMRQAIHKQKWSS